MSIKCFANTHSAFVSLVTKMTNKNKKNLDPLMSSNSSEHYTPNKILTLVIKCLGGIELDPCSNSKLNPNVPALKHYTKEDDGLIQMWNAKTLYMNPPYGNGIKLWCQKLVYEYECGNIGKAIALVPARTDTRWFNYLTCYPFCFIVGRLTFKGNSNSAPFPSAIFYLGNDTEKFFNSFNKIGTVVQRIEPEMFVR